MTDTHGQGGFQTKELSSVAIILGPTKIMVCDEEVSVFSPRSLFSVNLILAVGVKNSGNTLEYGCTLQEG